LSGESLRVAVVGLGKMGLLHASILNVLPNVQLTALCDKSRLITKLSKSLFKKVCVVDDVEKLSDSHLDAVYVTTPIPTHYPVAKTICVKGIARNLFVEKTLASSYKKAKELCELAQTFGDNNMVGYMKRFAVTFRKAKDVLDHETLGELISFDAYAYSSDFSGIKKGSKPPTSRGGVLADLGSHVIDLALWLFGELEVDSAKLESLTLEGPEDSACFSVKNSNGLEGRFDVSWCMNNYRLPEFGLMIRGSKGVMRVDDYKVGVELNNGKPSSWYRHNLRDNVGFLLGDPEYFREDAYFVKSILEDRSAEPSFLTASKVDYTIDQVKDRAGKNEQL
jgi:predicted dehydrogenase